jgi:hypothetical protein
MKTSLLLVAFLAMASGTVMAQGGGNSPTGVTPNYKPGGDRVGSKPSGKNIITRPGGQGHNSGASPTGKTVVAPTTGPAHPNKRTASTSSLPAKKQ